MSAFLFFSWNKFILTQSQFTVTLQHHGKGDEKDEKEERDEEVDEKEEVLTMSGANARTRISVLSCDSLSAQKCVRRQKHVRAHRSK